MYVQWLTFTRPDEEISWSEALEDEAFRTLIENFGDLALKMLG